MKIYNFDLEYGEKIEKFNSNFIFSKIIRFHAEVNVSCFYLDPNGIVGYHQAVTPQLFLVVQGNGWVRDQTSGKLPIHQYQAAFWNKDEWHEAGTDTGLVAIVLEGDLVNPSNSMSIIWDDAAA
ncbi:MAG: hypothetical protein JNM55_02015 [Anaerolineales bacterium]|nr:hypothetical protein [Anaerolineales bacterium]